MTAFKKAYETRKRLMNHLSRNCILKHNHAHSGHVLWRGLLAGLMLSVITLAAAMTSQASPALYVVDLPSFMARADRVLNESPALAVLDRQTQLKPFAPLGAGSSKDEIIQASQIISIDAPEGLVDDEKAYEPQNLVAHVRGFTSNSFTFQGFLASPESIDSVFELATPLKNLRISSHYGWRGRRFHHGLDLMAPQGTSVFATEGGTVVRAEPYYGYGNLVVIDHGNGVRSRYAHLGKMIVKAGSKVYKKQMIGTIGMTGSTTGPHLHFEVLYQNRHQDPETFLIR